MNLIIDIGNTRIKVAVFQQYKLVETEIISNDELINTLKNIQKKFSLKNAIISSVGKIKSKDIKTLYAIQKVITLDHSVKLPFINKYKTPKTLGVDRIALVAAAVHQFPKKNVLIIDAGSCITYDFVSSKKEYLGGAISPGINMRYRSLNHFTANLPKLEISKFSLTGINTNQSIHSGILNGILHEINGVIAEYQDKYPNLTVVLTGGDTNFLAKKLKSSIFANPNFLLEGLNSILIHNIDE
jgi:type III pantothenate kinase